MSDCLAHGCAQNCLYFVWTFFTNHAWDKSELFFDMMIIDILVLQESLKFVISDSRADPEANPGPTNSLKS